MPINRERLALRAFNRKRVRLGEDFCDLIQTSKVSDGASGHKIAETTVASNVGCFVEELSGGSATVVAGGLTVTKSHRVVMEAISAALALTEHDKIKVLPRGPKAQMIFEQPIRTRESFSPLAEFKATFTSGYRKPAVT